MDIYKKVERFYDSYRGKKTIIGKSVFGRNLYAFFVGNPYGFKGICQYAIHAREWVTAVLALEQILYGVGRGGVWFLPLMNPDGAQLCQKGINSVRGEYARRNLVAVNGGYDFSLWKANVNCVDLNVNFDAGWGKGERNIRVPASENYIGSFPFSEPETRALRDFTLSVCPQFTVSYHTAGEEIYWYYKQNAFYAARDKRLAYALSRSTGYPLACAPKSHGGYKDWCISRLKIPSFTIEAGKGTQPLKESDIDDIVNKNLRSVRDLSDHW